MLSEKILKILVGEVFAVEKIIILIPDIFWVISGILSLSFGLYLNKQIKSLQLNYLFINLINNPAASFFECIGNTHPYFE
mgnify:CR=1 FL=1